MLTYQNKSKAGCEPSFEKPLAEIAAEVPFGGAIKILTAVEYHTDRQHRWYWGVCIRGLSDWNGDTLGEWDWRLKSLCGGELLKSERMSFGPSEYICRTTIKGVGKKNFTEYIENIISKAIEMDWPVTPPDPDLRRT